jgi:hypothetical protein
MHPSLIFLLILIAFSMLGRFVGSILSMLLWLIVVVAVCSIVGRMFN